MLFVIVAVTLAVVSASMKSPSSPNALDVSRIVLAVTVRFSVPTELSMATLRWKPPRIVLLVIRLVPVMPDELPVTPKKTKLPSLNGVATFVPLTPFTTLFDKVKPLTLVPRIP